LHLSAYPVASTAQQNSAISPIENSIIFLSL